MDRVAGRDSYTRVAIALHWLIALAVIANLALGLYFADLPRSDPDKFFLTQTHKSIGLTVLVLSLVRVGWRFANPIPPLPAGMEPYLRCLARGTQFLLYFLIIAIPLSGWIMVSASPMGLPTHYFGLFDWPNLPGLGGLPRATQKPLHHLFGGMHSFMAWSAIVLIVLHTGAALFHHFIRRDEVLASMAPSLRRGR